MLYKFSIFIIHLTIYCVLVRIFQFSLILRNYSRNRKLFFLLDMAQNTTMQHIPQSNKILIEFRSAARILL